MKDTPNFAAWNLDTLTRFATDAYLKMQEQQDQIEQLNLDKKTAIEQYRRLLAQHDDLLSQISEHDDWK